MDDLLLIACMFFLVLVVLGLLIWYWARIVHEKFFLKRFSQNPLLSPQKEHPWESEAVFNPGVVVHNNKVHMFYRAIGPDGVSRIGHAWSDDGIHFNRGTEPAYDPGPEFRPKPPKGKYLPLSYHTDVYASGGSWGGAEDPRTVVIGDRMYMSMSAFENWQSIRLAVTSISLEDLEKHHWNWSHPIFMSPPKEQNKNWVLFPEKIGGKFAILHALTPTITIEYIESLEDLRKRPIKSNNRRSGRTGKWDAFVRGASAPPIKTDEGWLLLYHGMDPAEPNVGYKVGAMLLKLDDPSVVLYRSEEPVLTPDEWYENDWKPGVVYASGATTWKEDLVVYYGGGDKYIAAAKMNLREFLRKLKNQGPVPLAAA